MLRDVALEALRAGRSGLVGWTIAVALVTVLYAAFYPSIAQEAFAEAMAAFPPALMDAFGWSDLTSAAGYLQSTVFGLLAPVLLIVYAIGLGGRAIAGDEEAGTLDLVVAHPVARRTIVLGRALAMVVAVGIASLGVLTAVLAVRGPAGLEALSPANVAAATLQMALLAIVVGAVALLVGAATGRRALAVGAAAGVAVLGYFANTVAAQLQATAWLRTLSPFRYAAGGEPLRQGLQVGDAAVLAVATVVLVAAAVVTFDRRDVGA